mgnify:FL=1
MKKGWELATARAAGLSVAKYTARNKMMEMTGNEPTYETVRDVFWQAETEADRALAYAKLAWKKAWDAEWAEGLKTSLLGTENDAL